MTEDKLNAAASLQGRICEYQWRLERLNEDNTAINIIWNSGSDEMKSRFKKEAIEYLTGQLSKLRKEFDEL